MKKAYNFAKALWFWYVVRWWWYVFPPKDSIRKSHVPLDQGQTLDDD